MISRWSLSHQRGLKIKTSSCPFCDSPVFARSNVGLGLTQRFEMEYKILVQSDAEPKREPQVSNPHFSAPLLRLDNRTDPRPKKGRAPGTTITSVNALWLWRDSPSYLARLRGMGFV